MQVKMIIAQCKVVHKESASIFIGFVWSVVRDDRVSINHQAEESKLAVNSMVGMLIDFIQLKVIVWVEYRFEYDFHS